MSDDVTTQVKTLLATYDPTAPQATADALRDLWLQGEVKSLGAIKEDQQAQQETTGIAIADLRAIGKVIASEARKHVDEFIPLARILWEDYGREGRVVALFPLGKMELIAPDRIMPLLMTLCRSCVSWEDADRLAMDALEPIVRKDPAQWLDALRPWLEDDNKWVRRAGITVIARVPMKHAAFTARCLDLAESLLWDEEIDVKKAVSFAIRLAARGDIAPVHNFLARHVPPENPAGTWVLCDAIRSMTQA
ncbi:MAG: DNA alkylation repair protein, partial [Anaerolineae bacterium]|nr:DNA alkylation repair protein [Anaerolineae bacterium]